MHRLDLRTVAEEGGSKHDVAQFAYVAFIGATSEFRERGFGELRASEFACGKQGLREVGDVLPPFVKSRSLDDDHRESLEEVGSESSG